MAAVFRVDIRTKGGLPMDIWDTSANELSSAPPASRFRPLLAERVAPTIDWIVRLALRELFSEVRVEQMRLLPAARGWRVELVCRCALQGCELDVAEPDAIAGHVESQISVALADRFGASMVERVEVALSVHHELICSGVFLACAELNELAQELEEMGDPAD
jgi:hypothetical protein